MNDVWTTAELEFDAWAHRVTIASLGLRHIGRDIQKHLYRNVDAYVLPESWKPQPYTGPGACPDFEGTIFGRTVMWDKGERFGVLLTLPKPELLDD